MLLLIAASLFGAVFAAAPRRGGRPPGGGEPFGSLILAVAVTVIEVGMIVMLMAGGVRRLDLRPRHGVRGGDDHPQRNRGPERPLIGALRHRLVAFNASGSGSALATVITLAGGVWCYLASPCRRKDLSTRVPTGLAALTLRCSSTRVSSSPRPFAIETSSSRCPPTGTAG